MRPFLTCLPAIILLFVSGLAKAAPPSQAQVDQLLEVTHAREIIDSMLPQIRASQQQMVQEMLAGMEISADEQGKIDTLMGSSINAISSLLSWEELRPIYHDLYVQTFNADEVQAMIDFYTSPVGQSMAKKMPQLTQSAMQAMQAKLLPALQEFQQHLETLTGAGGHLH